MHETNNKKSRNYDSHRKTNENRKLDLLFEHGICGDYFNLKHCLMCKEKNKNETVTLLVTRWSDKVTINIQDTILLFGKSIERCQFEVGFVMHKSLTPTIEYNTTPSDLIQYL